MKLLTAIKKAKKKADERYGDVIFEVKRKYGNERRTRGWIRIDYYEIAIEGYFELEDLFANDWIIEEF